MRDHPDPNCVRTLNPDGCHARCGRLERPQTEADQALAPPALNPLSAWECTTRTGKLGGCDGHPGLGSSNFIGKERNLTRSGRAMRPSQVATCNSQETTTCKCQIATVRARRKAGGVLRVDTERIRIGAVTKVLIGRDWQTARPSRPATLATGDKGSHAPHMLFRPDTGPSNRRQCEAEANARNVGQRNPTLPPGHSHPEIPSFQGCQ